MTDSKASSWRGIIFLITALFIFSLLNALIKGTVLQYSAIQLVFFRCFFAAIPAGLVLLLRGRIFPSPWPVWKFHLLRGGMTAVGLSSLFIGIGQLSLSDSMALYFSSTLFLVMFSHPILKEKVSGLQWMAVLIGLVGILIIAKPTEGVFQWGSLFVIMGAGIEAANNLVGRLIMTRSDQDGYMLTFIGSLLPALLLLIPLYFVWVTPDFAGWVALICLGLGGGIGQLCVTFAYTHAPAGILAPMVYSAMIWSVMLDVMLYQVWPTPSLVLGCSIIIISGLLTFYGEARGKKKVSRN